MIEADGDETVYVSGPVVERGAYQPVSVGFEADGALSINGAVPVPEGETEDEAADLSALMPYAERDIPRPRIPYEDMAAHVEPEEAMIHRQACALSKREPGDPAIVGVLLGDPDCREHPRRWLATPLRPGPSA